MEFHVFCQLLQDVEHRGPRLAVHLHLQGHLKGELKMQPAYCKHDSVDNVTLQVDLNFFIDQGHLLALYI